MEINVISSTKSLLGDDDSVINASVRAALTALHKGALTTADIDCIMTASGMFRPSSFLAEDIKKNLGIFHNATQTKDLTVPFFSLKYLIDRAKSEIEAGLYERVLILSTETSQMRINWTCLETTPVVGEVVWAIIVGKTGNQVIAREEKMAMYN